jgi:hypothetical protein
MVWRGAWVVLVAFVMLVCAAAAGAASQYPALGRFEGLQETSTGIAVAAGSSGDVFVGDQLGEGGEQVVRVFAADGVLEAVWSGAQTPSGSFGSGHTPLVAVDDATHSVYVADRVHHTIDVFEVGSGVAEAGKFKCQITGVVKKGEVPSAVKECAPSASSVPLGSGPLSKEEITALGVDPATGRVFVGYGHAPAVVYRFNGAGEFEEELTGAPAAAPEAFREFGDILSVGVDDAGLSKPRLLVNGAATEAHGGTPFVCVFEAETDEFVECWTGAGAPGGGLGYGPLTVDEGSGLVYLSDGSEGVSVYEPDGSFVAQIAGVPGQPPLRESGHNFFTGAFGEPQYVFGLAVNASAGRLYAEVGYPAVLDVFGDQPVKVPTAVSGVAGPVHAYAATVNGSVNPEGVQVTSCRFEIMEDGQEWSRKEFGAGRSVACAESPAEIGFGGTPVAVHAVVDGLSPQTKYHVRLVAANGNESANPVSYGSYGLDAPFSTLPVPVVISQESEHLTAAAVELRASVNPEGSQTSCLIEYGTGGAYGEHVPCEPEELGSGSSPVDVKARLAGLTAGVTYHWRVVVESVAAKIVGADQTFVYLTGVEVSQECGNEQLRAENRSVELPDCRAYEQVTPVFKNGGAVERGLFIGPTEAAADGSHVIGISIQGFEGTQSSTGQRRAEGDPYEFARSATGWVTTPMAPPAAPDPANPGAVWTPMNTNYAYNPDTQTALFSGPAAPAGQDDFYLRQASGAFSGIGPATPPATGETGPVASIAGASRDETSFTYTLAEPVQQWPFDGTKRGAATLYEYAAAGSEPELVGVTGGVGARSLVSVCGTKGGGQSNTRYGSLSADGRVAFFTALKCSTGSGENAGVKVAGNELLARIAGDETLLLSGRAASGCGGSCASSPVSAAEFQGASEDGSIAYFTSAQQLIDGASEDEAASAEDNGCAGAAGPNGCNLYMYDFNLPAGERLVDVSAGDVSGAGPQVQGVMAISSDGSHVYFVAGGVLAANGNGQDQTAQKGANNLYVYERDGSYPEGHVAFIAQLPNADARQWDEGTALEGVNSNVTPTGEFFVFESYGALTADQTRGLGPAQIYRYDARSGELARVSAGVRGYNDNGNAGVADARLARPRDYRLDPSMSNNGEYVFFESPTGLTPGALNNVRIGVDVVGGEVDYAENVYEWHAGRVYLISDGLDTGAFGAGVAHSDVHLIGSDASGENVFFTTADQLVAADTDTQVDVYDARVDGGFVAPVEQQGCLEADCRGAGPLAPLLGQPLSGSFQGAGNAPVAVPPAKPKGVGKRCGRRRRLSHGRCVRRGKAGKKKHRVSGRRHGAGKRKHAGVIGRPRGGPAGSGSVKSVGKRRGR